MLTDRALVGLQEATHKGRVLTAREDLLTYASDATPLLRQTPGAIVIPKDAEEVAAVRSKIVTALEREFHARLRS